MTATELLKEHGSIKAAAEAAGLKYHTFYARLRKEQNAVDEVVKAFADATVSAITANPLAATNALLIAATPTGSPAPSPEDAEGVAAP